MYILFTWFTSFTEYAEEIFQVISNFTFKDQNLAENLTTLAEHLNKKGFPEPVDHTFCKSDAVLPDDSDCTNAVLPDDSDCTNAVYLMTLAALMQYYLMTWTTLMQCYLMTQTALIQCITW